MARNVQWPRLVAEGAAIVTSILLAFAIDAWWERHQRNQECAAIVTALSAEFAEARLRIEARKSGIERIAAHADTVASLLALQQTRVEIPLRHLVGLIRTPTFDPPMGEVQALLQTGNLDLISDRRLRQALAEWPAAVVDLEEKSQLHVAFVYDQLIPALRGTVAMAPLVDFRFDPPPNDSLISITASPELIGLVENLRLLALRTLRSTGGIPRVHEVLEGIEDRLATITVY